MTPSPRKSGKTTSAAGRDGITCAPRPRCLRRSCSSSRSEAGRRMEQNEFCDGCATAAELACDSVLRARVAVCSDSVLRDVTAAEVDQRERVVVDRSDSAAAGADRGDPGKEELDDVVAGVHVGARAELDRVCVDRLDDARLTCVARSIPMPRLEGLSGELCELRDRGAEIFGWGAFDSHLGAVRVLER